MDISLDISMDTSVGSLLDPGFPSSHSWIPGFRRLTLGSRVSVVSLVIPYSSPFFRKFSGKFVKSIFPTPGTKIKFWNFHDFFYAQYFLYKPLFPSSQALKTLKIESAMSKSTGGLIYSSVGPPGATFSPVRPPGLPFLDKCFLHFANLGPLKAKFDQPDR